MTKNRLNDGQEGSFDRSIRETINNNLTDVSLCSTQLDKTSNTTLADVVALTTGTLTPGTYRFTANLAGTAGASGGWKVAFNYLNGLTLTSIESTGKAFTAAAVALTHTTTVTTQTSLIAATSATIKGEIDGTFVVATSGTIQLQFAQNVSDGTACSIYVGSRLEVTRIGN